jgi:hypothetical protein
MAISDWDHRQLCPDGSCVGVIGPEGTCKVCGRVAPDWGDERRRGLVAPEDDGSEKAADNDQNDQDEISPSAPAVLGEVAEWQRRRLCGDGACIGVIGPDGRCKACGKPASGAATNEEEEDDEDEDEDNAAESEDEGDEEDDDEDEDAAAEDAAAEDEGDEDGDGDEDEDEEDGDEDEEEEDADEAKGAEDVAAESGGDLDDRKLCPDGACIGVIGPDGRCKVCGKEAA